MKEISIDDIKKRVRLTLDEVLSNESENFEGEDDTQLDNVISSKVVEALRFVHGNAESSLLESGEYTDSFESLTAVARGEKSFTPVRLYLGGAFLRLVKVECGEWSRSVTSHLSFDDVEYSMQKNYLTIATPERPLVFLGRHLDLIGEDEQGYCVELYSVRNPQDAYYRVGYLNEPELSNDKLKVCDKLVDAFIYYLSGLVLLVLNDAHADDCFNMSNVLMGVTAQKANEN